MSRRLFPASRPGHLSQCARCDADRELAIAFKARAEAEGVSTQVLLLELCRFYLASLR